MDPAGLTSLPTELLFYIFLFLSEDDLFSLSYVCSYLYHVMNDDAVWKRFISDQVRGLEVQPQQVSPDKILPDSGFLSANRKHLLRKRRLLNNWSLQHFVKYESKCALSTYFDVLMFKYNHVVLALNETAQLWDISGIPRLCCSLDWPERLLRFDNDFLCLIIGDSLVVYLSPRVWVYQINIQYNCFPFLYSFYFDKDSIVRELIPSVENSNYWRCSSAGKHLVFYEHKDGDFFPKIHIWDIVNACKVGCFTGPRRVRKSKPQAFLEDQLILKTEPLPRSANRHECAYMKFSFVTQTFSKNVFITNIFVDVEFYKDICIKFVHADGNAITCQVFEFETSLKMAERTFEKLVAEEYSIIDGLLVVGCRSHIFIVSAFTLKTINLIPHKTSEIMETRAISVFGFRYLLVLGDDREDEDKLQIWDIRKNPPVMVEHTKDHYLLKAKGWVRLVNMFSFDETI